jgi:thiol-disulfide isomerase/thioredoxin
VYNSEADMEIEAMKFFNDTIISKIKQDLDKKEKMEMDQFQELLNDKMISEEFFNLVRSDRAYFYKGVLSMIASIKYMVNARRNNNLKDDDFRNMWFEAYETHPVTNPDLLRSPWFFYYVQNYLRYFEFTDTSFGIDAQEELYKQGLLQTHKIENAKKYLSDSVLEYYIAASLSYASFSKNYEKELISLFDQFKEDYPSSKYLPFLEPEIKSIVKFHELKDESFGDGIKFIDVSQNNDSFDGIIDGLKGKKVYVDIWATWCAPCKVEFGHKKNLNKLLKINNIETLYISIDKDERAKQWEDMIKYYDLKGFHIRANEELNKNLTEIIGGRYGIPRYFLVDESGNIVNKLAEPPSRIEKLQKQIVEM